MKVMQALAAISAASFGAVYEGTPRTNAACRLFICATPQDADLDQAEYEALTWVEIKGVGSHGEIGANPALLTYNTWGASVQQHAKGQEDAGTPDVELARIVNDAGQVVLRQAARTANNYAFKMLRNDNVDADTEPTTIYNRGVVSGPRRPMGRSDDFELEIFKLGLNQREIIVDANASGNAPSVTAAPSLSGTETVGEVLTCSNGTWSGDATIVYTFRWFRAGVPIDGATANTYTLVAADTGKVLQCRVVATNDSGNGQAFSDATGAIAAA